MGDDAISLASMAQTAACLLLLHVVPEFVLSGLCEERFLCMFCVTVRHCFTIHTWTNGALRFRRSFPTVPSSVAASTTSGSRKSRDRFVVFHLF